jgi:excisionase family DNA binding protein
MLTAANPNEQLTAEQAAEILGVSEQTLSVWRCTGRYALPYLKIGRLVRYRRCDLEAWLASRLIGAVATGEAADILTGI